MATMARAAAQAPAVFMARAAAEIPILGVSKGVLISNLARVISSSSRGVPDQSKAAQWWTVSCVYYQSVQARSEPS